MLGMKRTVRFMFLYRCRGVKPFNIVLKVEFPKDKVYKKNNYN